MNRHAASGLRAATGLAAALLLGGCMGWPLDRQLTSATMLEPTPLDGYLYGIAEEKPLERAFIELPWLAGRPIAVREKRYANGVEQTIVLESEAIADGENRIEVRVVQGSTSDDRITTDYLQVRSSRQEQIRSDMKEFVWGVPMRILPSVEANAYGTYGYAIGRTKLGFNCLLGWQNVKGVMKRKQTLGFMTARSTDMSLRFRICRSDLSEEQLVSVIRGYRITFDPDALLQEPKMVWRNDGINISGTHGADSAVPGYITEGLAPGAVPPAPDVAPVEPQPAVAAAPRAAPAARPPASKPVTRPREPERRAPDVRRIPRQDEMVREGDPSRPESLDPMRNRTTIFVDPREYASVPMPGQVSGQAAGQGQVSQPLSGTGQGSGSSRFLVPGAAPQAASGDSANPQSQDARERRKEMVRQIPLGGQTLSETPSSGGGGSGRGGLFLAPEREGYRGLDVKDLQRTDRVQGDNAKHNLWLNDVARNDRDGLPLQRPCELMRECEDEPARAPSPAPRW